MLSMKTLKVAIGTLGSAFLLSAGVANAAVNLNDATSSPTLIAAETLTTQFRTTGMYTVLTPNDPMCVDATTNVELFAGDDWFVRLDLTGMVFAMDPMMSLEVLQGTSVVDADANPPRTEMFGRAYGPGEDALSVAQGGIGESMAIYRINLPPGADNRVQRMQVLRFLLGEGRIAVTPAVGTYAVSVSVWEDLSEARAGGTGSFGQELFSVSGNFLQVENAVEIAINAGTAAVADVATGFQNFTPDAATNALLGNVSVTARSMIGMRNFYDANVGVLDADDMPITDAADRFVDPDTVLGEGTTVTITGHGTVGNIALLNSTQIVPAVVADQDAMPPIEAADETTRDVNIGDCRIAVDAMGEPTNPNLVGPGDTGTFSGLRYTHGSAGNVVATLCFDARAGNTMPIPLTTYTADAGPAYKTLVPESARLSATSGTIGEIKRNGTTVNLTYLTTHPSYNQRVIIVNRSGQPVTYALGELVAEDGIEVTAMDGAEGSVGAGEKAVIRVDSMVMFEASNLNRRRAAGTLALNGPKDHIAVATTQVNSMDGSTDTVLYESLGVSN